jgi:hypothetical protein
MPKSKYQKVLFELWALTFESLFTLWALTFEPLSKHKRSFYNSPPPLVIVFLSSPRQRGNKTLEEATKQCTGISFTEGAKEERPD